MFNLPYKITNDYIIIQRSYIHNNKELDFIMGRNDGHHDGHNLLRISIPYNILNLASSATTKL